MSKIIRVGFGERQEKRSFSADVYSYDMKKYRFQVVADSVSEAYDVSVKEAVLHGVNVIRCIAIYFGFTDQSLRNQCPVKVWQRYDPVFGGLVEY